MKALLSSLSRAKRTEATKAKRRPSDFYGTPQHAIVALLAAYPPPVGVPVVEPAAGDGAIVRELVARGYRVAAVELRAAEEENLRRAGAHTVVIEDWFAVSGRVEAWWRPSFAIVSNPPFSLARAFCERCLELKPVYCAALLRINVEASNPWREFWDAHPWTQRLPLWHRPSFTGDGKTDGANYIWAIWERNQP